MIDGILTAKIYHTEEYNVPFTIKKNGKTYSVFKNGIPLKTNIPKYDIIFAYEGKGYNIDAPDCDVEADNMIDPFITSCSWAVENKIDDIKFNLLSEKFAKKG